MIVVVRSIEGMQFNECGKLNVVENAMQRNSRICIVADGVDREETYSLFYKGKTWGDIIVEEFRLLMVPPLYFAYLRETGK